MACVAYTYIFYPLLISLVAHLRGRLVRTQGQFVGSVSIVLAAYNEEAIVDRRLDELIDILTTFRHDGEIVVVSDGSTDSTAVLARGHTNGRIRVLELSMNGGKAAALTCGCAAALGDVIVFADARQRWAPDALEYLLRNFADPEVGAVSGDLVLETDSGVMSGVGLYWRFEKWLRRTESLVHSTVGVTGAISAVRRELFCPIPKGTVLDDVYWPLQVVLQGYRVVHEENARAFDRLPEKAGDEFRRKLRTLSGNFQLLMRLPVALLPWRNPLCIQFVSHKLMRLVVPWALLVMLIASALLPAPLYQMAFVAQMTFYVFALAGIWQGSHSHLRLASAAGSFLLLNAAAWLAFWVWITGKVSTSWRKVLYRDSTGQSRYVVARAGIPKKRRNR
jgi:cellulose synthase/poly-beta-1,6-N-acetylglucosamine synthase-like glycosyltransferase